MTEGIPHLIEGNIVTRRDSITESITILIADESKTIVQYLMEILNNSNDNILYTHSPPEAKKIIQQNDIDILVCDSMLPDQEGSLEIVRFFKQVYPQSKVLGISVDSSINNIISMIKSGGDDFWQKTSTKHQFMEKINRLKSSLNHRNKNHREVPAGTIKDAIIGENPAIKEIRKKIEIVARNQLETCLIGGESGTGKELVAKQIHQMSPRCDMPFIALNCAGIPESLIDSELFGFEKGSFTGAYKSNAGKFELADRGVLFLDEISEMPVHLQAKLLRVLEDREILRIGGKTSIPIDVMILAATNQNLVQKISDGRFREDIYYRLNMVKIELPSLRGRPEDIPLLIDYFLGKMNAKNGHQSEIEADAVEVLKTYAFPGNVRELKNIIYNATLFSENHVITRKDIQVYLDENSALQNILHGGQRKKPRRVTNRVMLEVLEKHDGNITVAAKELGYSREGLSRRLKKIKK